MMVKRRIRTKAEILLGKKIKKLREARGMTRLQLGRKVNRLEQQIKKYEEGEFVPLPVLEQIAITLGARIPKKLIRVISSFRKFELETNTEQEELSGLYGEILIAN